MQNNNSGGGGNGNELGQMAGGGGSGGGGVGQMTAQQQQQYRAAMQQQQLAAMQAASRSQQGGNPAAGMQARPGQPQPRPQAAVGASGTGNAQVATQQQMQALQQLFQNNPEQLAAFVNMSREGKVTAEQLAHLREVVNAAQSQGQSARPPAPSQQQQRPPAAAPQQQVAAQQQQQQQAVRPTPARPAGQVNQIDLQKFMSQLQRMAEPISKRINQLDAQLQAPVDKGGLAPGSAERTRAEAELADLKQKQQSLGQKFLAAKAQHLQQQGQTQEAQQLVQQMQQRAAAQQAAAASGGAANAAAIGQGSASQQAAAAAAVAAAAAQRRTSAQPGGASSSPAPPPATRPGMPPGVAGQQGSTASPAPASSQTPAGSAAAAAPHVPMEAMVQRATPITSSGTTIPAHLHVAPSVPEPYPNANGPRPTLTQGLNTNPMLGTPAILQRPDLISGAGGSAAGGVSGSLGQSNSWEELLGVPLRDSRAGSNFDARLSAMSGEELANEMANPDFWDAMSGRGTGADSLMNAGSTSAPGSAAAALAASSDGRLLSKRKVQELIGEIDPSERLEGAVEDLLLEVADEFIDSVAQFACRLAKHRKGDKLEVRDVQLHLERSWNLRIPTPGSMPIPPPRIKPAAQSGSGKGNAAATASH